MERSIIITLLYNKREIEIELPSTYEEFLKLLEDKLYLTKELVSLATISYNDSDGDKNIISYDNYDDSKTENNGFFEMELVFPNENNINKSQINDKLNKDEIKEIEKKIAKKYAKIFEEKLKKKDLEYEKEISEIKKNFENTMNTMIENNENQFNVLSNYYNEKMKENFEKYNQMIIENLNEGISHSNLNKLMEEFFNNNKQNFEEDNDDLNSRIFSQVIKK
jgi:hypothetical protein